MAQLDNIIERVKDFPTLPTIFTKVLDMLANPNTTVQDLAALISKDLAISGKVLQVVNSPIYGLTNRVGTISQAIFYIGFNEVRNICLAVSVIDVFKSVSAGTVFNVVELWKHSIAVGVTARFLAKQTGVKTLDDYFISGIMHDIGKLFFVKYFANKYLEIIEEAASGKVQLETLEKQTFGATHLVLGEMIAKKWNLPKTITNSIRYHQVGITDRYDPLVACVHLADLLANSLNLGNSGNNIINAPNMEIWKNLSLPNGFFIEARDSIKANYNQSIAILKLDK